MQKFALILFLLCCFTSCKSSRQVSNYSKKAPLNLADKIVDNAKAYNGVNYKYGGITEKGMDCSGLVYVAFKKEQILLPRTSRNMAKKGVPIHLNEVKKGDLLFFQTSKNKQVINHVGLIIHLEVGITKFIHSTTGNGVIISSLDEPYWKSTFIEARRIL